MAGSIVLTPAPAASWQSHTRWGFEIGSLRVAVTRTRAGHGVAAAAMSAPTTGVRPAGPLLIGAFAAVGALTLLVAGATAAPRPAGPVRYMVSVPIPVAAAVARTRPHRIATGRAAARRAVAAPRLATATPSSDEPFGAADAPHVARAMTTGAFQEWEDAAGRRRFLTAGPARAAGGRFCRTLALMVRAPEGTSHVRTIERCGTGPVPDDPVAPRDDDTG